MPDSDPWLRRRPRLAYPFTVLKDANTVRLIAGEDYRYTLTAPGLDTWLPAFLEHLTGQHALSTVFAHLPAKHRPAALQLVQHLYGERALVDGPAATAHVARRYRTVTRGAGDLAKRLAAVQPTNDAACELGVLCQDTLDFDAAALCARESRQRATPFLWVSTAALTRAYVSPLFLPDVGPCFTCLLRSFQRLSPAPELYDALHAHAATGGEFRPVNCSPEIAQMLHAVVSWKLSQAEQEHPAAALYRLHVLDYETMEVSTHRVFIDPECPECR